MKISSNGKRGGTRLAAAVLLALFTFKENPLRASPEDGPRHLAALLAARAPEIARMKTGLAAGERRPEWSALRAEIDAAAHQKDAAWSGLYWYTDLPSALAAAKRESKPVLSLRLLGRLDEELSCANSRFFRTALYANAAISQELHENWILHWESVRPAPKVTIDFGDGRTLTRTVTGNSLHYVLDSEGRARDVLPGLWAPEDFLRRVRGARGESLSLPSSAAMLDHDSLLLMRAKAAPMTEGALLRMLTRFEKSLAEDGRRNAELRDKILPWLAESPSLPALTARIYREAFLTPNSDPWLGLVAPDTYTALEGDPAPGAGPDALRAGALTASKILVERPMLAKIAPGGK